MHTFAITTSIRLYYTAAQATVIKGALMTWIVIDYVPQIRCFAKWLSEFVIIKLWCKLMSVLRLYVYSELREVFR